MSIPVKLEIELTPFQLDLLRFMAEHGPLGESAEEVVQYLIMRSLDDLMRCEVIRLSYVEANDG